MDIKPLILLLKARWQLMNQAKDAGQSTGELAVLAAVLIVAAAALVAAIKFKVAEKIGIISGS